MASGKLYYCSPSLRRAMIKVSMLHEDVEVITYGQGGGKP
jgi:hypothetical protein